MPMLMGSRRRLLLALAGAAKLCATEAQLPPAPATGPPLAAPTSFDVLVDEAGSRLSRRMGSKYDDRGKVVLREEASGAYGLIQGAAAAMPDQPRQRMEALPTHRVPLKTDGRRKPIALVWGVDTSLGLALPPGILNAQASGSVNGGPGTGHGLAVNIYGNMGAFPGPKSSNGAIPQQGNVSLGR